MDLYDDVLAVPSGKPDGETANGSSQQNPPEETNGNTFANGGGHHGRRFQLYIGNLSWVRTSPIFVTRKVPIHGKIRLS